MVTSVRLIRSAVDLIIDDGERIGAGTGDALAAGVIQAEHHTLQADIQLAEQWRDERRHLLGFTRKIQQQPDDKQRQIIQHQQQIAQVTHVIGMRGTHQIVDALDAAGGGKSRKFAIGGNQQIAHPQQSAQLADGEQFGCARVHACCSCLRVAVVVGCTPASASSISAALCDNAMIDSDGLMPGALGKIEESAMRRRGRPCTWNCSFTTESLAREPMPQPPIRCNAIWMGDVMISRAPSVLKMSCTIWLPRLARWRSPSDSGLSITSRPLLLNARVPAA